jgi:hypothetical protein
VPRLSMKPAADAYGVHPVTMRRWILAEPPRVTAVFEDGQWWIDVPDEVLETARQRRAVEQTDELARDVARLRRTLSEAMAEVERIQQLLADRLDGANAR